MSQGSIWTVVLTFLAELRVRPTPVCGTVRPIRLCGRKSIALILGIAITVMMVNIFNVDLVVSREVRSGVRLLSFGFDQMYFNGAKGLVPRRPPPVSFKKHNLDFMKKHSHILTLITSIKDSPGREEIHRNTIKNWAALSAWVRPVLYMASNDSEKWRNVTLGHEGWRVRTVPREIKGIPVLKDLMLDAMSHTEHPTPFYGFANADNLFDFSLVETLDHVLKYDTQTLMLVGERTNLVIDNVTLEAGNLAMTNVTLDAGNLAMTKTRTRENTFTHDYFITSPSKFPWEQVPDFVIGRPGYDNWLIAKSIEWNITVIDATFTLHDLHQTGSDGNKAGWQSTDVCINLDLIGRLFYRHGRAMCAPQHTIMRPNNTMEIRNGTRAYNNHRDCIPYENHIRKNSPCIHRT